MEQQLRHSFITQRPKVTYVDFLTWNSPGTPVVKVTFNQPVGEKSVQKALSFQYRGQKVPVKVHTPEEEKGYAKYVWDSKVGDFVDLGHSESLLSDKTKALADTDGQAQRIQKRYKKQKSDKSVIKKKSAIKKKSVAKKWEDVARRYWLVEPSKELPLDTDVSLYEASGLRSAYGKQKGVGSQVVNHLKTLSHFKFVGVKCRNLQGDWVVFKPSQLQDKMEDEAPSIDEWTDEKCAPIRGDVQLQFSSPVLTSEVRDHIKMKAQLTEGEPKEKEGEGKSLWGENPSKLRRHKSRESPYSVYLPSHLKVEAIYKITVGENLKDEFGRRLGTPVNILLATDERKPNWILPYRQAVVEKGIGNDIPIYVTNLESLDISYQGIHAKGHFSNKSQSYTPQALKNVTMGFPVGLEKLLEGHSGALYAKVSSIPAVNRYDDSFFFAQSTHYQVMVKLGHFNTLVWVTDMRTGQGVKGAQVELLKGTLKKLTQLEKVLEGSPTDAQGLSTFEEGTEIFDPNLQFTYVWQMTAPKYFVKVVQGEGDGPSSAGWGFPHRYLSSFGIQHF